MTNAEKFKKVFGFEFALAPYEADCWCPFQRTKCRDTEFDCFEDCVKPFWQSDYQGTPTIPLSVIEKITAEIEERATYEGIYLDRADVLAIIDKAVKECTHEKG